MIAIGRLVKLIAADVGEDHGWAAEHAIFQSDTFKNRDIVVRNISDDNSPSTAKDQHRNKITFFLSERIFQIANDFSGKTENRFRIRDIR